MKKCVYCGCEIAEESVIDFCNECGKKAFSEKMLKAIIENMESEREKGNLNQGLITESMENKKSEADSIGNL